MASLRRMDPWLFHPEASFRHINKPAKGAAPAVFPQASKGYWYEVPRAPLTPTGAASRPSIGRLLIDHEVLPVDANPIQLSASRASDSIVARCAHVVLELLPGDVEVVLPGENHQTFNG